MTQAASADGGPRIVTVMEMANALLLYNEPILNHRFHDLISRRAEREAAPFQSLPPAIADAEREIRMGAVLWEQLSRRAPTAAFIDQSERMLLEAFLSLTEAQIRMVTYMARAAPSQEVRRHFDRALAKEREVAAALRALIPNIGASLPARKDRLRSVQEEEPGGSIRQQIEQAIETARGVRKPPRLLLVSHTALRHLRDEGCFRDGETDILGVPVVVDWGWEAPAFALQTFSSTPLEEMLREADDDADAG